MGVMSRRVKVVAIVCIAVFALTAITATPVFALIDAQTPIDALFSHPASEPALSLKTSRSPHHLSSTLHRRALLPSHSPNTALNWLT